MCETVEIKEQDNIVIENELQTISSEELVESDVKTEENLTEEQKNDKLEEEEANEEKEGFLVVQNDSEEPEAVTPSSSEEESQEEEEEEEIHLTESETESAIKEDEYGREYLVHNDIRYYREPKQWNTPYLVELSLWLILFINFFDAIVTVNQLIPSRK